MRGPIGQTWWSAWRTPGGRAGALTLLVIAVSALVLPPFLPEPSAMRDPVAGAVAPGLEHPMGTDHLSRDVLARVVSGARVSLAVAGLAVLLSITLGAIVGLVSGYTGGLVDGVLMRLVDGALAVPRLFILLLLVLVLDRVPMVALVLVIGATGWFATARLVRGEVLRLRHEPFVQAAEALGARPPRVAMRHLLPNVAGPLIVAATLGVGDVILLEAGLSFLGLGVQAPAASWGGMILEARPILLTAPWAGAFPGLAIVVTVLAANLCGEALQGALDPRTA